MKNASAHGAVRTAIQNMMKECKGRYSDWLAGMLVLIVIRALALVPLLALVYFQAGDSLQYIALLSPILYVFVVLPLRYSMGEAMDHAIDGEAFSTVRLISFKNYGSKLHAVFMQCLHLLPWALPLIAGLLGGWYLMYKVENGASVLRMVIDLGKSLGEGHGFKEGVYIILAFGGLLFLVLLFGMMYNGMVRFVWPTAGGKYLSARKETQRRLKGRRFAQFCVGLIQTLLMLPGLLPIGYMGYRLLREYLKNMQINFANLQEPQMLIGIVFVFFLLYLPFLPHRKVLQAQFIHQLKEEKK